jgi:hypothetical protein
MEIIKERRRIHLLKLVLACSVLTLLALAIGFGIFTVDNIIKNTFKDYGNPDERPPAGVAAVIDQPVFYPNAQDVKQAEGGRDIRAANVPWAETASFTTSDDPAMVVAFYERSMLKNGWRLAEIAESLDSEQAVGSEARFNWDYPLQVDTGYYFNIRCDWRAAEIDAKRTSCEIIVEAHF